MALVTGGRSADYKRNVFRGTLHVYFNGCSLYYQILTHVETTKKEKASSHWTNPRLTAGKSNDVAKGFVSIKKVGEKRRVAKS